MFKKSLSFLLSLIVLMSSLSVATFSASATSYETKLKNKGFTDSYVKPLVELHKKYPNWVFEPFKTNLDWQDAVDGERSYHSKQIVQKSSEFSEAYYCNCSSCASKSSYYERPASEAAVKYYMDPRNWLTDKYIFQFESNEFDSSQTVNGVEGIISSTWMSDSYITYKNKKGTTKTYYNSDGKKVKYSTAIMDAAKNSNLSPYFIASKIVQEVGGRTNSAGGASGTYKGYEGIYNYYNIGASTGAAAGLKWAAYSESGASYNRPWTNPYKSIYNGALYIANNFKYQFTGYLQKFNVNSQSGSLYNHEYMTTVHAASSESYSTYKAYNVAGILSSKKIFYIPVFKNMPSKKSPEPSGKTQDSSSSSSDKTVTGLKLVGSTTETLTYSWDKVSGATKYFLYITNVERGTNFSKEVTTNSATLNGLTVGNKYSVKVKAYANGWQDYSITLINKTKPAKAHGLVVKDVKATSVKLYWKSVDNADGYIIYKRKNNTFKKYMVVSGEKTTSATVTGLYGGNEYKFKIAACVGTTHRAGAKSGYVTAKMKPSKVKGVKLTPTSTTIKVNWSKVSGLADGYRVSFARDKAFNDIIATKTVEGQKHLTYTGKNFTNGHKYYIRVRSYKKHGKKTYYGAWSKVVGVRCE